MSNPALAKRIFLTGFSGSGKSTLAPLLAARLGYACLDTDAELEKKEGLPCAEIIRSKGLACFRSLEESLILALLDEDRCCVVALGGGAVTMEGMIPRLRQGGLVVWVQVKLEEILDRLRSQNDRPLLQNKSVEEVQLFFRQREACYRQAAHLALDLSGLPPDSGADRLCREVYSLVLPVPGEAPPRPASN